MSVVESMQSNKSTIVVDTKKIIVNVGETNFSIPYCPCYLRGKRKSAVSSITTDKANNASEPTKKCNLTKSPLF